MDRSFNYGLEFFVTFPEASGSRFLDDLGAMQKSKGRSYECLFVNAKTLSIRLKLK